MAYTSHYTSNYWLVNLATNQYVPLLNVTDEFWDDDWKQKTPFKDFKYIDLSVQKIDNHQKFNDHLFYGSDPGYHGAIVGVYADTAKVSKEVVDQYIAELRNRMDVAALFRHDLTLCEEPLLDAEPEESSAPGPR